MTELLEKMSYETRLRSLEEKVGYAEVVELLKDFAKEVELAYKAGMLHFNALDHTLLDIESLEQSMVNNFDRLEIRRVPWIYNKGWNPAGPVKPDLLVSLYLQEKGFK